VFKYSVFTPVFPSGAYGSRKRKESQVLALYLSVKLILIERAKRHGQNGCLQFFVFLNQKAQ
jgi:hypothetical protein